MLHARSTIATKSPSRHKAGHSRRPTRSRIVTPNGTDVATGAIGELWCRGPYTIRGYFCAPERNRDAFSADGFYRTGDLVRLDTSGSLVVEGRIKDLINRGGEKINAEEIEAHLLAHPAVSAVAIVAMPDAILGEKACAYLSLRDGDTLALSAMREFLAARGVAQFKWPERIEIVTELPLTNVGKIKKVRTATRYSGQTRRRTRLVSFRSSLHHKEIDHGRRKRNAAAQNLIEKLERNNRTLRSHPTIEKIERGELSQPQLRHWATQLFIGNKAHNANILGLIYAKCDDFPARKAIVENLIEEELGRVSGANRSHPELYLEFGEAIGIPRAELLNASMTPDATAMMHWMYWLADSKPWYVTLAGISLGSELFNPDAYVRVIDGLSRHYKLSDDALMFFSVHVKVDKDHGDSSAGSIFRAIPESAAAETLWAVETHIELMRRLWSDINPPPT